MIAIVSLIPVLTQVSEKNSTRHKPKAKLEQKG